MNQSIIDTTEYFHPISENYSTVLIIDCNDSFTHNLVQEFLKLGAPVRVVKSHTSLSEIEIGESYIVFSPGPGRPDQYPLPFEIYKNFKKEKKILGVCLGFQIINEYYQGVTLSAPIPVHGKTSLLRHSGKSIFQDIPNPTPVARYHSLMIKINNPDISVLATIDTVPMAYQIGNTIGVQFHPESFLTTFGSKMLQNFLEV